MPRSPDPARTRLVSAGERLFAVQGIDNVSLREISRASGARNVVALQHHFGDRDGLLRAIVAKHQARVGERRQPMLDDFIAHGGSDVGRYAAALVQPLAACLADDGGGRYFVRIFADLMNRPRPLWWRSRDEVSEDSLERWRRLGDPLLGSEQRRLHRRYAAVLYVATEIARRAAADGEPDVDLVASATTDIVVAILSSPVSATTRALLATRDDHRPDIAYAGPVNPLVTED
ncbi:MAG TPA: helix-turn-helix domain-containing protein [Amycolatopsis sp.]|nr:helix-turn-helix domain-containing protein [Amycolatopsis sp.]